MVGERTTGGLLLDFAYEMSDLLVAPREILLIKKLAFSVSTSCHTCEYMLLTIEQRCCFVSSKYLLSKRQRTAPYSYTSSTLFRLSFLRNPFLLCPFSWQFDFPFKVFIVVFSTAAPIGNRPLGPEDFPAKSTRKKGGKIDGY